MAVLTSLRPSSSADRAYVEHVYFETQRWIIEALFGWRGDDVEQAKFAEFYDQSNSAIIVADGKVVGWMTVIRQPDHIELASIYLQADRQRKGIGTALIRNLMREASEGGREIRLSTAIINPARSLYARLGFVVVREEHHKVHMTWPPPKIFRVP
jgi:ribosomal protein S18 acetylase RimI-like enzyme